MSDRRFRIVWALLLCLYVCMIYANSMTPSRISSQESGFVLQLVQRFFQQVSLDNLWLTEHIIRKMAHFLEYTGLGVLLLLNTGLWKRLEWRRLRPALEGMVLIPFVDETIQLFTPGRSAQISDVWLDISGCVCGMAAAGLLSAARSVWRKKRYEL